MDQTAVEQFTSLFGKVWLRGERLHEIQARKHQICGQFMRPELSFEKASVVWRMEKVNKDEAPKASAKKHVTPFSGHVQWAGH